MRKFADSLPTLREKAPAQAAAPAPGFEPEAILKALAQGHSDNAPASEDARTQSKAYRPAFTADRLPKASASPLATPGLPTMARDTPRQDRTNTAAAASVDEPEETLPLSEVDARVAAAITRARAEAQAAAAQDLAAAQQDWAQQTADAILSKIDESYAALHNRIADALADALIPIFTEAATTKAVERFSDRLSRLAGPDAKAAPVTVKGPPPLIEALRKANRGDGPLLKLVPADAPELEASVNETTLRTTIRAYTATLTAAAGPRHVSK